MDSGGIFRLKQRLVRLTGSYSLWKGSGGCMLEFEEKPGSMSFC